MIEMRPYVVYPSAGHNNSDPGAIAGGLKEADLTKELRNLISAQLNVKGHKHVMDNDTETNSQYQARIKPGSGSVLVDHHFNAAANSSATGTEVLVASDASTLSRAMATELAAGTAKILGVPNRGVKSETQSPRGRLGILHTAAGIACLVEVCFISNPADLAKYKAKKNELAKFYAEIYIKYDNKI